MSLAQRRSFLIAAGALIAAPLTARAQAPQHARVGYLSSGPSTPQVFIPLLLSALRELGWVEGRNLTLERRFADNRLERLTELASEFVHLGVQVIVTPYYNEAQAARRATRSIPIVTLIAIDPVKAGLAESVARPGGNVTGVLWGDQKLAAKLTEIIKEIVPGVRRLGVLYVPTPVMESYAVANEAGARALGLGFHRFHVLRPEDVEAALGAVKRSALTHCMSCQGALSRRRRPVFWSSRRQTRFPRSIPFRLR